MLRRYVITAFVAVLISLGVFYEMQALIRSRGPHDGMASLRARAIEFVRLKRDTELQLKERALPEKPAPPAPPPTPDMDLSEVPESLGATDLGIVPALQPDLDMMGGSFLGAAPGDSDVIPMVRVNPQYPLAAAERGIEGWTIVRFSINAAGVVKNPEVIDAEPAGIFDRAALRAIRRWKYKPKTVDGTPVERRGVTVRLKFELDK